MEDRILSIINHYGVMPQLKKFQEEIFELNEAIINYQNTDFYHLAMTGNSPSQTEFLKHIAEEIADVTMMLEQFQHYYGISNSEIYKIMEQKVDRQLRRIENEEKK